MIGSEGQREESVPHSTKSLQYLSESIPAPLSGAYDVREVIVNHQCMLTFKPEISFLWEHTVIRLPKAHSIFTFEFEGYQFYLYGDQMKFKSIYRSARKFTIDL